MFLLSGGAHLICSRVLFMPFWFFLYAGCAHARRFCWFPFRVSRMGVAIVFLCGRCPNSFGLSPGFVRISGVSRFGRCPVGYRVFRAFTVPLIYMVVTLFVRISCFTPFMGGGLWEFAFAWVPPN